MADSTTNRRMYMAWRNMRYRCNSPRATFYEHYGGRGIGYDKRWESFSNFYEDMASTYSDKLTLDRIDNEKDYSPDNCRWVSMEEQCNNRRSNHFIEINGIKKTVAQWIKESDVKPSTVRQRFYVYGWSIERSLGIGG